jgi:hypothetical protein
VPVRDALAAVNIGGRRSDSGGKGFALSLQRKLKACVRAA